MKAPWKFIATLSENAHDDVWSWAKLSLAASRKSAPRPRVPGFLIHGTEKQDFQAQHSSSRPSRLWAGTRVPTAPAPESPDLGIGKSYHHIIIEGQR